MNLINAQLLFLHSANTTANIYRQPLPKIHIDVLTNIRNLHNRFDTTKCNGLTCCSLVSGTASENDRFDA